MVLLPVLAAIAAPIRFARCEPHDRSAYSVLPGLCRKAMISWMTAFCAGVLLLDGTGCVGSLR